MQPKHYVISKLISKSLQNKISNEERAILERWLDSNEQNRVFFENLKDSRRLQSGLTFLEEVDTEDGWRQTARKLRDNEDEVLRRKPSYRLIFANFMRMAAILILIVGVVLYFTRDKVSDNNDFLSEIPEKSILLPAESVAHLQLSDDQVINITDQHFQLEEINGVNIFGRDGELIYKESNFSISHKTNAHNILTVPKKGFYKITLSDGTKVWLNADSKLQYPVQFNSLHRTVELSGEAYFEVTQDAARPFYVKINNETIRVLGTRFNVNSYSNFLKTTLLEGSVLITSGNISEKLHPGQEALLFENKINVYNADLEKVMAWKNGEFLFRNETIVEIMEEISRWYNVNITYENKDLQKRFTGNISRDLKLPEVLDMLSFLSDYNFQITNQSVIVKLKN